MPIHNNTLGGIGMKFVRAVFSVVVILFCLTIAVSAETNTGFEINLLPEEEGCNFLNNINLSLVTTEPEKREIECFDVNDDGIVAVGFSDINDKTILVYSSTGDFLYGYAFSIYGSFGCEWDGNNLNIYFVRGGILISVDPSGIVLSVVEVPNSTANVSYFNNVICATQGNVGESEYYLTNDNQLFSIFSSYSQLIVVDKQGTKTIIYDATQA